MEHLQAESVSAREPPYGSVNRDAEFVGGSAIGMIPCMVYIMKNYYKLIRKAYI
jgi:hypothetical protein